MRALVVAVSLVLAMPVMAAPVAPGFNANQIAATDDSATGPVALGVSTDFFGVTFANTFVSNNPVALPEPSTIALIGFGLAGLAILRRRL